MARLGWQDIYLNEMILKGEDNPNSFIIAFDDSIYIGDDDYFRDKQEEILSRIKKSYDYNQTGHKLVYPDTIAYNNTVQLIEFLQNYVSDLFYGYLDENRNLYIYNKLPLSPYSTIMNKIQRDLNLTDIKYIDKEEASRIFHKNLYNSKPINGFHGTNLTNTKEILKNGLLTNKKSNYAVEHSDLIFLSLDKTFPIQHANKSSKLSLNTKKFKNLPVIIEFEIPDKTKLIQDFDMENLTGVEDIYKIDKYFPGMERKEKQFKSNNPMKSSKDYGLFAYKGNIYPNLIKFLYVPEINEVKRKVEKGFYRQNFQLKDMVKINKEEFNDYLNKIESFIDS